MQQKPREAPYSLADKNPYSGVDISALKIYFAEKPDIQVRKLFPPSEDMSDSVSSVCNIGDEYIPNHNILSVSCVSGRVPVGDRDRAQSLLWEDNFCLRTSQVEEWKTQP